MLASWMSNSLPLGAQQLATQWIVQIVDVTHCYHDVSSLIVHEALQVTQVSGLQIHQTCVTTKLVVVCCIFGEFEENFSA